MAGPGPNYELYQQKPNSMYLIYKSDDVGIAFLEREIGVIEIQAELFREEDCGIHGHALFTAIEPLRARDLSKIFWRNQPNAKKKCNHESLALVDTIDCSLCHKYLKIIPIRDSMHSDNVYRLIERIQEIDYMKCDPR